MRTLFIAPNSKFAIKSILGVSGPPLGMAYIASYIRENSEHEVRILDALTLNHTPKDIAQEVKRFDPDVVGIGVPSSSSVYDAYETAHAIKEVNPDITIATGGVHMTFTAEEALRECRHIDAVVRGEGEATMLDLLSHLETGRPLKDVLGLSYRTNGGEVVETPRRPLIKDLDSIPYPAYDLLPMDKYRMGTHPFAAIITSRGCPYRCTFCSSSELFGRRWRARSSENIIGELRLLRDDYGVSEIEFLDDVFTLDHVRVEETCSLIRREGLDIRWTCSSRVDTIVRHPQIARHLREGGCSTVYLGAESGCQRILNVIKKGITIEQIKQSIKILKDAGLRVLASFVLGLPGETREEVEKTIDFAAELDPDLVQFTICTPYPGTPLYREAEERGWLLTKDWRQYNVLTPVMRLSKLSFEDLNRLLRKAYVSFYARPSFIWRHIKMKNFFVVKKAVSAAFHYLTDSLLRRDQKTIW